MWNAIAKQRVAPERTKASAGSSIFRLLFGRPLKTSEGHTQKVGPFRGIPILGLDALGSASYGPEAALTVLIPLGAIGLGYVREVVAAILVLLAILYFSYRQTIAAYPNGGGSYTVAKENLGQTAGLIAAASLMLDYLLNVAVAISAGVGALPGGSAGAAGRPAPPRPAPLGNRVADQAVAAGVQK